MTLVTRNCFGRLVTRLEGPTDPVSDALRRESMVRGLLSHASLMSGFRVAIDDNAISVADEVVQVRRMAKGRGDDKHHRCDRR